MKKYNFKLMKIYTKKKILDPGKYFQETVCEDILYASASTAAVQAEIATGASRSKNNRFGRICGRFTRDEALIPPENGHLKHYL